MEQDTDLDKVVLKGAPCCCRKRAVGLCLECTASQCACKQPWIRDTSASVLHLGCRRSRRNNEATSSPCLLKRIEVLVESRPGDCPSPCTCFVLGRTRSLPVFRPAAFAKEAFTPFRCRLLSNSSLCCAGLKTQRSVVLEDSTNVSSLDTEHRSNTLTLAECAC